MMHRDDVLEATSRIAQDRDPATDYYLDRVGTFEMVAESPYAEATLDAIAESDPNPVQRVPTADGPVYGVFDFEDGDVWFGFELLADGQLVRRVVCRACMSESTHHYQPAHATGGMAAASEQSDHPVDAGYDELADRVEDHYLEHDLDASLGGPRSPVTTDGTLRHSERNPDDGI